MDACARRGIFVGDGAGMGSRPELSSEAVCFNGVKANSHETFLIERVFSGPPTPRHGYWTFTKTARKPYDLAVTACLILARHHFGVHFLVTSDGEDADWNAARALLLEEKILDSADVYHMVGRTEGRPMLTVCDERGEENP